MAPSRHHRTSQHPSSRGPPLGFDSYGTGLFGHTAIDVIYTALRHFGNCTLKLVINGPAANQPLPDFYEMFIGCRSLVVRFGPISLAPPLGIAPMDPPQMQTARGGLLATRAKRIRTVVWLLMPSQASTSSSSDDRVAIEPIEQPALPTAVS